MAQRKKPKTKPTLDSHVESRAPVRVSIDKQTISSLALHSGPEKVKSYFQEVEKHVQRLGLKDDGTILPQVPVSGTYPTLHDVIRWLKSLQPKGRFHRQDRIFLKDLYATLKSRLPVEAS